MKKTKLEKETKELHSEVCNLAKKMADEFGGKPSNYMKDAWRTVRRREEERTTEPETVSNVRRKPEGDKPVKQKRRVEVKKEAGKLEMAIKKAGLGIGKALINGGKKSIKGSSKKLSRGVKRGASDLNFLKAPKDSPRDILPDSMKNYFKDTFKF